MEIPNLFLGQIRGYCDNGDCDIRQVRLFVKRDENDSHQFHEIFCPLCREPLLFDGVVPQDKVKAEYDREAIQRVNVLRYLRDNDTVCYPLSIALDDRLPL